MCKWLCLAVALFGVALRAQSPGIVLVGTAPSGACPQGAIGQLVNSSGHIWTCQSITGGVGTWTDATGGGGSSGSFGSLTGGTNTTAAMVVGSGASLNPTGTGIINANQVNGAAVPASATVLGSNSSQQPVDNSSLIPTLAADNAFTGTGNSFASGIELNGGSGAAYLVNPSTSPGSLALGQSPGALDGSLATGTGLFYTGLDLAFLASPSNGCDILATTLGGNWAVQCATNKNVGSVVNLPQHYLLASGGTGETALTGIAPGAAGTFLGGQGAAYPSFSALSAINPQTSTYQVLASDFNGYKTIAVSSGTFTITLVASSSQPLAGEYINIFNYGSGTVTVAPSGQNINGSTSPITLGPGSASTPSSIDVISNGTDYFAMRISQGTVGTVTSVGLTVPSWLSVSGSPITSSGTFTVTAATGQTANEVLATPNGSSGALGLRTLVDADLPGSGVTTVNGTSCTLGSSCSVAHTNGTVTYTSSQTASASDEGKLVIMNCGSACAYTLPATQPASTWTAAVQSIGSTVATIALGGSDTFNGSSSVPVLKSYSPLSVWANSSTSTDYRGSAQSIAGSGISITAGTNGQTIANTGALSVSGDGALYTNSSSTGAVTLTPGNTGVGYGIWGNIASTSGAPGYNALSSYPTAAFPPLNQNTAGTAANLSGTPTLPNGTKATTQAANDTTTDLATDAFVTNQIALSGPNMSVVGGFVGGAWMTNAITAANFQLCLFSWTSSCTGHSAYSPFNIWLYNLGLVTNSTNTAGSDLQLGFFKYTGNTTVVPLTNSFFGIPPNAAAGTFVDGAPPTFVSQGQSVGVIADGYVATGSTGATVGAWTAEIVGNNVAILGGSASSNCSLTLSATTYVGFDPNPTVACFNSATYFARMPMAYATTLENFCIWVPNAQGSSGSLVATLMQNGSATSIVATVPASGGTGMYCDTTHTVSASAADYFSIQFVNNSTSAVPVEGFTLGSLPSGSATAYVSWMLNYGTSGATASTTLYFTPFTGVSGATESLQHSIFPRAGTMKNLRCYIHAAPASNSTTVTVYHNGSPTSLAVTVTTSQGADTVLSDTTDSFTFAAPASATSADTFSLQTVTGSGTGPVIYGCAAEID